MAKITPISAVAKRKLGLALVTLLSLCISESVEAEANFTMLVSRRSTGDLYKLNSGSMGDFCAPNTSYLVNEQQCVLDKEFFLISGMIFYDDVWYNCDI